MNNAFINSIVETIGHYVPSVFGALAIFIAGYCIAIIARKCFSKLLRRLKLDERLQGDSKEPVNIEAIISSMAYYLILLYVLLMTLGVLGIEGVLDPAKNMLNEFLTMFPNILAAVLIGYIGYIIAKVLSAAVRAVTKNLDKLTKKAGLGASFNLSNLLAQVVFIITFIPILVSALDTLKIESISQPATGMLKTLLAAVPNILAAAMILGVAFIVGRFVKNASAEIMKNLGADCIPEKLGAQKIFEKYTFSKIVSGIVFYFIMLGASISAVEKLSMPIVSTSLGELLIFSGQVVTGLIILAIGNLLANLAYNALKQSDGKTALSNLARFSILAIVTAMGMEAMGIADDIVNLAFGLTLGAIAVSVALSFGLGGREAAGKQMEHWLSKLRN